LESVICNGGGTECTAVHMELDILFCWSVLKVPLCYALGHIHVYCWGSALRMPIGGYCFVYIGCALGNVASTALCLSEVVVKNNDTRSKKNIQNLGSLVQDRAYVMPRNLGER
jgi:hypothetical protein